MKFCDNKECVNYIEVDEYLTTLRMLVHGKYRIFTREEYILTGNYHVHFCNICHNAIQMRNNPDYVLAKEN